MTDNLFNPEAFEQMPGQMSMADVAKNPRTWDGEPMYSAETVAEAQQRVAIESGAAVPMRHSSVKGIGRDLYLGGER